MMNRSVVVMCFALSLSLVGCKKGDGGKKTEPAKGTAAAATGGTKATPPAKEPAKAAPKAAASTGGFAGTYKIDKDAMLVEMKAKIAKLPPEQQKMAGLMVGLVKSMDMTMTLNADGNASFKIVSKNPFKADAPPKEHNETGTWKEVAGKVAIKAVDKQKNKEKNISCEKKADHLVCTQQDPSGKGKAALFFKKV